MILAQVGRFNAHFRAKLKKEVREKMQAIAVELNTGTYKEPLKMTVGEWLDIWEKYSLQGTTQGRYLTGGVPPVRFSM